MKCVEGALTPNVHRRPHPAFHIECFELKETRTKSIGIPLPSHHIPKLDPRPIRREINRPIWIFNEEICFPCCSSSHLVDQILRDFEAVACEVDGGGHDRGPGEFAVVFVEMFCSSQLARYAAGSKGDQ